MKAFRQSLFAWIALLGIVFSQLAVSAYACPMLASAGQAQRMDMASDMAGMPCASMGAEKKSDPSPLCVQHCDQGHQSVSSLQTPDFHPALVLFLVVPPVGDLDHAGADFLQAQLPAIDSSPPPLLRTGRLRI